jgi:hypothetical protein
VSKGSKSQVIPGIRTVEVRNMLKAKLTDEHPGKWNEGVEVFLCHAWVAQSDRPYDDEDYFATGVRVPGTPAKGMFDDRSGPLQVIVDGNKFTMSNLGEISAPEQDELIREGKVEIIRQWDDDGEIYWKCLVVLQTKVCIKKDPELNYTPDVNAYIQQN